VELGPALDGNLQRWTRHGNDLVLLLAPTGGFGPSTLAVAGRGGVRSVSLPNVTSGYDFKNGRVSLPGLATDPTGRALVVTDATVTAVDLRSLRVEEHAVVRRTTAKGALAGDSLRAAWLGGGILAVWGSAGRVDRGGGFLADKPFGLRYVDTRSWTTRVIDGRVGAGVAAGALVLAWAPAADVYGRGGIGLLAYNRNGTRRFHLFGSKPLGAVVATHGLVSAQLWAYTTGYEVVDPARGRTVGEVLGALPPYAVF
jgi:hypothetical protein